MKTNEQIAREAGLKILSGDTLDTKTKIILSAIEGAREAEIKTFLPMVKTEIAQRSEQEWTPEQKRALAEACISLKETIPQVTMERLMQVLAQPQRSEEWTPEYIEQRFYAAGALHVVELSQAINAALTAERRRREKSDADFAEAMKQLREADDFAVRVKTKELREQLLSALAAIEKHNLSVHRLSTLRINIDLSTLDKHDAEVCKPLMDALRHISTGLTGSYQECVREAEKTASDALAKVKEGKLSEPQRTEREIVEAAKALFYNEAAKDKIGFRYRPIYDAALDTAINAALAAERQQRSIDTGNATNTIAELERELAAEREAHAKTAKQYVDARAIEGSTIQKLMSALAAIQWHNESDDAPDCYAIEYDKTTLDEHDDKVRKPLMDLLLESRRLLNKWATRYAESEHAKKDQQESRAAIAAIDALTQLSQCAPQALTEGQPESLEPPASSHSQGGELPDEDPSK